MSQANPSLIYATASPDYREATTAAQSEAIFTAIQKKLGQPVSSQQTRWQLNRTASGTFLTSVSKTEFSKQAAGEETFVWKQTEHGYKLAGYNISSNELITR